MDNLISQPEQPNPNNNNKLLITTYRVSDDIDSSYIGSYRIIRRFELDKSDNDNKGEPVACTQDAKQCSDGSYVSRIAPTCEFDICPGLSQDLTIEYKLYEDQRFKAEYPEDWLVDSNCLAGAISCTATFIGDYGGVFKKV